MLNNFAFISNLTDYMFIFVFCLLGAIVKDTYNTITEKDTKVKISRILISTVVASVLLFSVSDYLLSKMSTKLFILPCFIGGGLGFEIFGKISKVEFLFGLVGNYSSKGIIQAIVKNAEETNKESKNKDPTKNDEKG